MSVFLSTIHQYFSEGQRSIRHTIFRGPYKFPVFCIYAIFKTNFFSDGKNGKWFEIMIGDFECIEILTCRFTIRPLQKVAGLMLKISHKSTAVLFFVSCRSSERLL